MEPRGFVGGVYRLCEWVMRLAYLNILWILFTLMGLIILGIFPATAAMFAVTRKWVLGERDASVFRVFWSTYKAEFLKSNFLGAVLGVSGAILLIDFKYFNAQEGILFQVLTFVTLSLSFLYAIAMIYIFPVFVHYELKNAQIVKNAFLIGLARPIQTITLMLGCGALFVAGLYFSQLLFFFGGSTISLFLMTSSYQAFKMIERKKYSREDVEELTVS